MSVNGSSANLQTKSVNGGLDNKLKTTNRSAERDTNVEADDNGSEDENEENEENAGVTEAATGAGVLVQPQENLSSAKMKR